MTKRLRHRIKKQKQLSNPGTRAWVALIVFVLVLLTCEQGQDLRKMRAEVESLQEQVDVLKEALR
jgi:hypothetical protein